MQDSTLLFQKYRNIIDVPRLLPTFAAAVVARWFVACRSSGGWGRSRWSSTLMAVFTLCATIGLRLDARAADPVYTFKPTNQSGSEAKGWYVHLPNPFKAADVVVEASGGTILKKVRVIDRGRNTGVTVIFETDGAGVPDKGSDELKLTLKKPLGKTGTSGFRNIAGVKGIPIGDPMFDPPWTDDKGGKGGTPPKEEKKRQDAPPEEGDEASLVDGETPDAGVTDADTAVDEEEPVLWTIYPYTSEETNDELFGDWADGADGEDGEIAVPVEEPAVIEPVVGDVATELEWVTVIEAEGLDVGDWSGPVVIEAPFEEIGATPVFEGTVEYWAVEEVVVPQE